MKLTETGMYQPVSSKKFQLEMFVLLKQFELAVRDSRFRDIKLLSIQIAELIEVEERELVSSGVFLGS